jgi:hypothetical protein
MRVLITEDRNLCPKKKGQDFGKPFFSSKAKGMAVYETKPKQIH